MTHLFDYREILQTLNHIGYKNISSEQLKNIKKDLNALIKYESGDKTHKIRHERPKSTEREKENKFPDRKFKSKSATAIPITHDANTQTQTINMPLIPTIRKSPAKQNLQKKPNEQNIEKNSEKKIPTKRKCVRNTPVDLYQKYKMDWEKFRNFIPGENKRVTVRNTMRDKMRVKPLPKPDVYICFTNGHKYTNIELGQTKIIE